MREVKKNKTVSAKYYGNEDEEEGEVKDGSAARELGQTVSK